jgi:hypothetical protein
MFVQDYLKSPSPPGQRNHDLYVAVRNALEQGWTEYEINDAVASKARMDGLSDFEIQNTIRSAMARPVEMKPALNWNSKIGGKSADVFLAWNDTINDEVVRMITNVPQPRATYRHDDLAEFLSILFEPSDVVAYNVSFTKDRDGVCKPSGRGVFVRSVQDILNELDGKDAVSVMGTKPECGGWIRLNPMDGKGIHDKNVVEYRYALVESDNETIDTQWEVIKRLKLPCATVVHSGGKSLHAAVRIDAGHDINEYTKRVAKLYEVLEANGLKIDTQNKNPSRLSRMPGVTRNDNAQYLVARNIGLPSWGDWARFIEAETDDIPIPESYAVVALDPPKLSKEIIAGVLRRGHKLLLGGPSKAGKSYALIALAAAVCGGGEWLGHPCIKGSVLYINLEIDRASFINRIGKVEEKKPFDRDRLTIWNLRGKIMSLAALSKRLGDITKSKHFDMIILDPIYKVNVGDENSARDMTLFCNTIEAIANSSGAAVCFAHHFSKGQQGAKSSIDRASGSGVFGRDPDAIGTLTELETTDGEDKNKYLLEWTLREFKSPSATTWEFIHPVHVRNDILKVRKAAGSGGRPKDLFPEQIIEAIQANHTNNLKSIIRILDKSESTIRRVIKESFNLSIVGGEILIDKSMSEGF